MEYSQVHVFHILGLHVHLIVTPNVSDITYVITIDLANGGLFFSSTPYVDVFQLIELHAIQLLTPI